MGIISINASPENLATLYAVIQYGCYFISAGVAVYGGYWLFAKQQLLSIVKEIINTAIEKVQGMSAEEVVETASDIVEEVTDAIETVTEVIGDDVDVATAFDEAIALLQTAAGNITSAELTEIFNAVKAILADHTDGSEITVAEYAAIGTLVYNAARS